MLPNTPAQVVTTAFAITILLGGLALMLPIARTGAPAWPVMPGMPIGPYLQGGPEIGSGAPASVAFFTATSATCVTGLIVVDTATYWTGFGQFIIAVLIQVGGLGTMTFASLVGIVLARRLALHSRVALARTIGTLDLSDVRGVVLWVAKIAGVAEGVVFLATSARFFFHYGYSAGDSLKHGAFLAVSSFNNAGFAMFTDNLIGFREDPVIMLAIAGGIISGGLGFPVIMELFRRRGPRTSMTTNLAVVGTVALLIGGWVIITAIEWNNPKTLGDLDTMSKLLSGFFASVTPRTAGFNAMDIGAMESSSLMITDLLMFIGGGPAGTAGGIKITTAGVVVAMAVAEIRGANAVSIMGSRLSRAAHRQATTVLVLAATLIFTITVIVNLSTPYSLDACLFEVISAFGTVGLSTGITPSLPVGIQVLLMTLMFIGRVGPLTLATALALRPKPPEWEYPKERPLIG